jgi:hypothetical protein
MRMGFRPPQHAALGSQEPRAPTAATRPPLWVPRGHPVPAEGDVQMDRTPPHPHLAHRMGPWLVLSFPEVPSGSVVNLGGQGLIIGIALLQKRDARGN